MSKIYAFDIFDNAGIDDRNIRIWKLLISSTIPADYRKCRKSMLSISSTIPADAFCQIGRYCRRYQKPTISTFPADYRNSRKSMLSISSTIPAGLQFWRICRECQKPNILTFSADANSAVIVKALLEMPGLSKNS